MDGLIPEILILLLFCKNRWIRIDKMKIVDFKSCFAYQKKTVE